MRLEHLQGDKDCPQRHKLQRLHQPPDKLPSGGLSMQGLQEYIVSARMTSLPASVLSVGQSPSSDRKFGTAMQCIRSGEYELLTECLTSRLRLG